MDARKHEIEEKVFEAAQKRAEDKFEEELASVDIRAVALKTKKALIEQAMKNNAAYNAALDYDASIKEFNRRITSQQNEILDLKFKMEQNTSAFLEAIKIMAKEKEEELEKVVEENKGFFRKFWEFIKCLMK